VKLLSAEKNKLERWNHDSKLESEQAKEDRDRAIAERERSKKVKNAW
jgi:hypothetical protein